MDNEILTDIPVEGERFGQEDEAEATTEQGDKKESVEPAESSTAKETQTGDAPSQEGAGGQAANNTPDDSNTPFNKHPRWKEMREKNEALSSTVEELKARLDTLVEQQTAATKNQTTEKIPDWFANIYGDNQEAWRSYQSDLDSKISSVKQDIRKEMEAERQQQMTDSAKWDAWMKQSMERVEETFNVKLADGSSERNEFLKYLLKYKPTDDEGNIDFSLGYEMFQEHKQVERLQKTEKTTARKQLAGATNSEKASFTQPEGGDNKRSIRGRSFRDLAIESLNEDNS